MKPYGTFENNLELGVCLKQKCEDIFKGSVRRLTCQRVKVEVEVKVKVSSFRACQRYLTKGQS